MGKKMTSWQALGLFLEQLRALLLTSVRTTDDLHEWQRRAGEMTKMISSFPSASDEIPEALWHFLADADIRFSDGLPVERMDDDLEQEVRSLTHRATARAAGL